MCHWTSSRVAIGSIHAGAAAAPAPATRSCRPWSWPCLWGAGRGRSVRDGLRVLRPPRTPAWVLCAPGGRRRLCGVRCSVGSRDRVSILRERQEPPPGRLAPRVLGPAWLRVQPQQVRSLGRRASERPVPCPPLSTQACLGAVTLPLGVQVWKATFSLGLGEANTEMERLFKSPPPL